MKPLAVFLCLAALQPVMAQPAQPDFVIRAETSLALVRFHVLRGGKYVENVRAEDIRILEDGVERNVALLTGGTGAERLPAEILLLFDVSHSVMGKNLLNSIVIRQTLLESLGDHVRVGVYGFGTKLKRFCLPTRDQAVLEEALRGLFDYTQDSTMLYEAIAAAARHAATEGGDVTRLMIVFSDGQATSGARPREAIEAARRLGIPVYPVLLGGEGVARISRKVFSGGPAMPPTPEQSHIRAVERHMHEFASIGAATGGHSYDPPVVNAAVVRQILESLAGRIRSEYVAGYYLPPSSGTGKPRRVRVVLRRKGLGELYGGSRTVID